MRRDHRPYFIKKAYLRFEKFYVNHFLRPQLEYLGKGFTFMRPWHVEVFGAPIELGDYVNVVASADKNVRLSVWSEQKGKGRIRIGNYCLICSGVRIGSAHKIQIGDSCMIASNAYLTDCDWHDVYDRISIGKTAPIKIENNVWIGDSAIVCKGVTIGENSIIGAGAVVVDTVPANCVAAGNPAKVVKQLDNAKPLKTRAQWFSDPQKLLQDFDRADKELLGENTLPHWLRYILFPSKRD
ncbi:MAG: acyltransferase [Deltaproteobacteria bacterium]|nr:acyltransferase [Deltaproteobacteria bacterium]